MNLPSEAMPGVGWSGWLGGVDWTLVGLWARFIIYAGCFVALVVLAYSNHCLIRKWEREDCQDNSERIEPACELDNAPRGVFCQFRRYRMKLCKAGGHLKAMIARKCFNLSRDSLPDGVNLFKQFFGFTHKCGEPPNEKLSDPAQKAESGTGSDAPGSLERKVGP